MVIKMEDIKIGHKTMWYYTIALFFENKII